MPSFLPPEILDLIFDHARDETTTLSACCLVSKSCVPGTRRHLFAEIGFPSLTSFKSWMEAFPDPFNSPAHYTRVLGISGNEILNTAIIDARPWLRSFRHLEELHVSTRGSKPEVGQVSFAQLHGLSPTLKFLHLVHPSVTSSQALDLICSFPLLEDLSLYNSVNTTGGSADEWDAPPASPKFTGTLFLGGHNLHIVRKLLTLPGGLRFSKITISRPPLTCDPKHELVSMCSETLESLSFDNYPHPFWTMPSLDLSKATKLKDVKLRWHGQIRIEWISNALRTAKSENLRQITIIFLFALPNPAEEAVRLEWQDLDGLLVELWTTRSICPVVMVRDGEGERASKLLPGLTSRGAISSSI